MQTSSGIRTKQGRSFSRSISPFPDGRLMSSPWYAWFIHGMSQAEKPLSWKRFPWVSSFIQQECGVNNQNQATTVCSNIFTIFTRQSSYDSYPIIMDVTNIVIKTNHHHILLHLFTFPQSATPTHTDSLKDENFSKITSRALNFVAFWYGEN